MKHKLKHLQCSEKSSRKDVPVQSSSAWCNIKYDGACLGDKESKARICLFQVGLLLYLNLKLTSFLPRLIVRGLVTVTNI